MVKSTELHLKSSIVTVGLLFYAFFSYENLTVKSLMMTYYSQLITTVHSPNSYMSTPHTFLSLLLAFSTFFFFLHIHIFPFKIYMKFRKKRFFKSSNNKCACIVCQKSIFNDKKKKKFINNKN